MGQTGEEYGNWSRGRINCSTHEYTFPFSRRKKGETRRAGRERGKDEEMRDNKNGCTRLPPTRIVQPIFIHMLMKKIRSKNYPDTDLREQSKRDLDHTYFVAGGVRGALFYCEICSCAHASRGTLLNWEGGMELTLPPAKYWPPANLKTFCKLPSQLHKD